MRFYYTHEDPVDGKIYAEGYCDSNENKPTDNYAEGSRLIETDTGDVYLFNERTEAWVRQMSLQD